MVRFPRPRPLAVVCRATGGRRSGRGPTGEPTVGFRAAIACTLVLSLLTSCGGGAGGESVGGADPALELAGARPGGDVPSVGTAASLTVVPNVTTASTAASVPTVSTGSGVSLASSVDTGTLQRGAADALIGVAEIGLRALDAVGPRAGELLARLVPRVAERVGEAAGTARAPAGRASAVLRAMLGVDGAGARALRDANTIAIDPDDVALCAAWGRAPDGLAHEACIALAARVEVHLTPSDVSHGQLVLRFDGRNTVQVVYGPGSSIVDLHLDGFAQFVRAGSELIEDEHGAGQQMSGRLRFALGAMADGAGGERAELALEVVDAVSVVAADGTRLAVAEGASLELVADVDSAALSVSVDVGETRYEAPDAMDGGLRTYLLPRLAGGVTFDIDGETFLVAHAGSRLDPATFSVDGLELARLELGEFAFRFDGRTDRLEFLDGGVEAAARVEDLLSGAGASLSAALSVPGRTVFRRHGEGRRRIDVGSVALTITRLGGPVAAVEDYALMATAGMCVDVGSERSSALPQPATCDP